jgi:hypothetical protein
MAASGCGSPSGRSPRDPKRVEEGIVRKAEKPPVIPDPTWGLERMIAALADVPDEYAGPLPRYG